MTDYYTCKECWGHAMYCGCRTPTVKQNLTVQADAITDIVRERARQITAEGWTRDHDDEHDREELARAAACYAYGELLDSSTGSIWPWDEDSFKPGWPDRRRDLVRAAALLVAEIERLDRLKRAIVEAGDGDL